MKSVKHCVGPIAPLILHGIQVPILETDVSPKIWNAIQAGDYEAKEASSIVRVLRPGDRVIELGSGLGIITCIMARIPDVLIWSFDANPHLISLARRVASRNNVKNAIFKHRLLSSSPSNDCIFFIRSDFWMSSLLEEQGPYEYKIKIRSHNIDDFIEKHSANVIVMDIEGAELELLSSAKLNGVDRVFLEVHDHLYGLNGVRHIFSSMDRLGFSYDPRGSVGPCVLFTRDEGKARIYED